MRFLIVASVLAYATAAPSGLYDIGLAGGSVLASPFALAYSAGAPVAGAALVGASHGVYAHGVPAPVPAVYAHGVAAPTISPGDIQAAAIDAHVEHSDHVRASVDATREYHDQAAELHGQAVNAAEDHSWQAVDSVKTHEAVLDGATAGAAPQLAKQIVGTSAVVAASPFVATYNAAANAAYAANHGALAYGSSGHLVASHPVAVPHATLGLGW